MPTPSNPDAPNALHGWIAVLPESVALTAEGIGFSTGQVAEAKSVGPRRPEIRLPLSSADLQVLFSMSADRGVLEALARTLLAMGPDEELTAEDTDDAACELANLLAGSLKGAMGDPTIQLGLPTITDASAESPSVQRWFVMTLDELEFRLSLSCSAQ